MSSENQGFKDKLFSVVMPKVYGFGAAIVIAGAMFKLLNWPGGALMLGLGLTTEAIIFILSSFEPAPKEVDWTKVYPELKDDYIGEVGMSRSLPNGGAPVESISEKLDELFAKAKLDVALVERLGTGMHTLSQSITHLTDLSNVVEHTEKYAVNINKAADNLAHMNEAQVSLVSAMKKLDSFADHTENFHHGIQVLTQTLNRANDAYAQELTQIQLRFENSKTTYADVVQSMDDMAKANTETENFRAELVQLNQKLSALNNVYDKMLIAFKS